MYRRAYEERRPMTRLIAVLAIAVLVLAGGCSSPTLAAPPPVPSPRVCMELGTQWLNDTQHVPDQVLATRADTMIACGLQELDPAKHGGKISDRLRRFIPWEALSFVAGIKIPSLAIFRKRLIPFFPRTKSCIPHELQVQYGLFLLVGRIGSPAPQKGQGNSNPVSPSIELSDGCNVTLTLPWAFFAFSSPIFLFPFS